MFLLIPLLVRPIVRFVRRRWGSAAQAAEL